MKFFFSKEVYDAWVYGYASIVEDDIKKGVMPVTPPMWEQVLPQERAVYERMATFLNEMLEKYLDRVVDESE